MMIASWKPAGAYVIGKSHEKSSLPCQDRIYYRKEGVISGVSLADGAGSCKYSHIGAEIITKTIIDEIIKNFDAFIFKNEEEIKEMLIPLIQDTLIKKAKEENIEEKELSSTLLFAVVNKDKYIAGHIGDGLIGALKYGEVELFSPPEKGEFSNETYFTTSNLDKHLRIKKGDLSNIDGFILASDGAAHSLYSIKKKRFASAASKILLWPFYFTIQKTNEIIYKNLENVIRKRTPDDCSIAILRFVVLNSKEFSERNIEFRKELLGLKRFDTVVNFTKVFTYLSEKEKGEDVLSPFERHTISKYEKLLGKYLYKR